MPVVPFQKSACSVSGLPDLNMPCTSSAPAPEPMSIWLHVRSQLRVLELLNPSLAPFVASLLDELIEDYRR